MTFASTHNIDCDNEKLISTIGKLFKSFFLDTYIGNYKSIYALECLMV